MLLKNFIAPEKKKINESSKRSDSDWLLFNIIISLNISDLTLE